MLLDEEVPAPRDFDGVGGEGHGACGEQGGEHRSDGLRELERARASFAGSEIVPRRL